MENILEIAAANQQRAREVIRDTGLEAAWRAAGAEPNLVGSLRTGLLMKHRDIDEGTGKSVDNPIFTQSGSGFPMNSNPSGPEMMARPFRNVDQKHLLMPIPELEMSVNKAIDTNNPGWN